MRLPRDRAVAHRAGGETLDDLAGRFDLVDRDRGFGGHELHQAADGEHPGRLVVDALREFLVLFGHVAAHGMLERADVGRGPGVFLAADARTVDAADVEHVGVDRVFAEGRGVTAHRLFRDFEQARALDGGGSAGEVLLDEFGRQADGVEDLRAAVRLVGRDAHLGHDLADALANGLDVVLACVLGGNRQVLANADVLDRLERDVGVDRLGTVAGEDAEVVHFARFTGLDDQAGLHAQALADEVMVHGSRRQQGRHRNAVGALGAVGQDQDVLVRQHGFGGGPAHFLDRHFETFGAGFGIPGHVDGGGAEGAVQRGLDRADLGDVHVGEDRLADFQALVRAGVMTEQVRARADHGDQAHHQFLADRVDRRVGDLREVLLEVVVEQARLVRQHRNRRVGAHRTDRIVGIDGHRLEEAAGVFLGVAEGLLAIEQRGVRGRQRVQLFLDHVEVLEHVLRLVEPLLVGLFVGQLGLDLLVLDDAALFEVDEEHLAGLETPLADDVVFLDRKNAAFRGHDAQVVVGDQEARRAQAVTVERGADLAAIGEGDGGGAVPGLHQRGVIFVERAAFAVHQRIAGPCLGDEHHHRVAERVTAGEQQFEGVVEAGGVRLAVRDQRPHLVEVGAEQLGFHGAAARVHPVHVAANRVDLAVVRHEAERVCQLPAREGVGREALVHEAERGDEVRIAQVVVERADLGGEQQALVDDRAAREARHVELGQAGQAMLFGEGRERVLGLLADREELAFEGVLVGAVLAAADKALADHRHRFDDRLAEAVQSDRNVAPADEGLAFLLDELLEGGDDEIARGLVLREEAHGNGIVAGFRQFDARALGPLAEHLVGQLGQNARAVAKKRIRAHRAAVVDVFQDFKRLGNDCVAFLSFNMGDEAHTAGVVFVARIVKALGLRKSHRY
ncbi:hypothetical protein NSU_1794 [Novosphingobium pentaromativorans US6-1]|uniref:NAD-specific glutamate dehydrogenase n=1 Tax=Novosphingobium pentaromativorans US6-1 TaxID=1088721 RepID=G6EBS3_9SPHN|nr:hypothetical protein NSU_1794 [Novosphingobium pentaromativorans US6-1]